MKGRPKLEIRRPEAVHVVGYMPDALAGELLGATSDTVARCRRRLGRSPWRDLSPEEKLAHLITAVAMLLKHIDLRRRMQKRKR